MYEEATGLAWVPSATLGTMHTEVAFPSADNRNCHRSRLSRFAGLIWFTSVFTCVVWRGQKASLSSAISSRGVYCRERGRSGVGGGGREWVGDE